MDRGVRPSEGAKHEDNEVRRGARPRGRVRAIDLALPPQAAEAQCDPVTGADCGGNKDEDKKPTATDVPASTAASGFTVVPYDESNNGLPTIAATSTPTYRPVRDGYGASLLGQHLSADTGSRVADRILG